MEGEIAEGDIKTERRKVRGRGQGKEERGDEETEIERRDGGRMGEREER